MMYKRGDLVVLSLGEEDESLQKVVRREADGLYQLKDVNSGLTDKNMSFDGGYHGCLREATAADIERLSRPQTAALQTGGV